MNKRHVLYVGLVLLAALVLFGAPMAAMAAHPAVTTLQADGTPVGATNNPYSPKQTCGGCHFDCATGLASTVIASFCQDDAAKAASMVTRGTVTNGTNCNSAGACPDYQSMAVSTVTKNQGYLTSAGTYTFMNYTVAIPLHGASTGKHMTQGRNEELTSAQRTIWGAPSTISGTGMWGRF